MLLPLKPGLEVRGSHRPQRDDGLNQLATIPPKKVRLQHLTTVDSRDQGRLSPQTKVIQARGCELPAPTRAVRRSGTRREGRRRGRRWSSARDNTTAPPTAKATMWPAWTCRGVQEDLIQAVFETGTPTVVVLINGRPLSTRWTAEHVPALVEAWEPGERGGQAVAGCLVRQLQLPPGGSPSASPGTPVPLPVYYNYKPSQGGQDGEGYVDMPATPLYPFVVWSRSFTTFEHGNLRM